MKDGDWGMCFSPVDVLGLLVLGASVVALVVVEVPSVVLAEEGSVVA